MTATIPVRKLNPDRTISVRLLNADGTEPAAGAAELHTADYPETRLSDKRYQLDRIVSGRKLPENLQWLSDTHPLLFEELLCFLETMDKEKSKSITRLLNHHLVPSRDSTESYILAYYRLVIDTSPVLFSLVDDGWYGSEDIRAWSLFISTRTACGLTVEHPRFKEVMLAVWIMQKTNHPIYSPFLAKDNEADIAFISHRFQEVFDSRHELRSRATIDSSYIEAFLSENTALRTGNL